MKKFRKGFTLLELLVVIGVMGILGATGMVAGQEATNAARATTIADGLEKAATAMMMYYSDNAQIIAEKGIVVAEGGSAAAVVATGASAYLKADDALDSTATPVKGKYCVVVSAAADPEAKWWVGYTFLDADTSLKAMIANKAKRMGLKSTTTIAEGKTIDDVADYKDEATVFMLVR